MQPCSRVMVLCRLICYWAGFLRVMRLNQVTRRCFSFEFVQGAVVARAQT